MEITTTDADQTKKFGEKYASKLVGGEILALSGDLGSGKTTFVQGLAKGLGITKRIISPTFILMRKYKIKARSKKSKAKNFYHIDLYRLGDNIEQELKNLGIDQILGKKENIVVLEWASKAKKFLRNAKWIRFSSRGEDDRKIQIVK